MPKVISNGQPLSGADVAHQIGFDKNLKFLYSFEEIDPCESGVSVVKQSKKKPKKNITKRQIDENAESEEQSTPAVPKKKKKRQTEKSSEKLKDVSTVKGKKQKLPAGTDRSTNVSNESSDTITPPNGKKTKIGSENS
jgi:hypothetical protein